MERLPVCSKTIQVIRLQTGYAGFVWHGGRLDVSNIQLCRGDFHWWNVVRKLN